MEVGAMWAGQAEALPAPPTASEPPLHPKPGFGRQGLRGPHPPRPRRPGQPEPPPGTKMAPAQPRPARGWPRPQGGLRPAHFRADHAHFRAGSAPIPGRSSRPAGGDAEAGGALAGRRLPTNGTNRRPPPCPGGAGRERALVMATGRRPWRGWAARGGREGPGREVG